MNRPSRERLVALLGEHADWDTDYIGGTYSTFCICGYALPDVESGEAHRAHLADVLAAEIDAALAEAWDEGHRAGRDYQGDGWNADMHDPAADNPYRAAQAAHEAEGGEAG